MSTQTAVKTNKLIYFEIIFAYILIFVQYPLGVMVSRFVLHTDLTIQPGSLLLWSVVRLLFVLPLLFSMLGFFDGKEEMMLQLGNRNRMFAFAFWGTILIALLGIFASPLFLNQTGLKALNIFYLLPIFAVYAITNSFCEELFFRGISLTALKKKMPFWAGNLVQAFFFALIHFTAPSKLSEKVLIFVIATFILGLFWGWTTRRTKSLIPAIIMHMIADLFVAVALF